MTVLLARRDSHRHGTPSPRGRWGCLPASRGGGFHVPKWWGAGDRPGDVAARVQQQHNPEQRAAQHRHRSHSGPPGSRRGAVPVAGAPPDPFHCARGCLIAGRYKVTAEMGRGNFARVVSAADTAAGGDAVAVKMLHRDFARDAAAEHRILRTISAKQPRGGQPVLRLLGYFEWENLPCFVLPLLGPSLSTRRFGVLDGKVGRWEVMQLASQLAAALDFLHFECRIVHTDLKPDNILLDRPRTGGLGGSWTIADLGSASFHRPGKMDQDLITTRPYRAVEAVLRQPWSYPADMWSVGCVLAEVWTGRRLFEAVDDATHVAVLQQRLGQLPESIAAYAPGPPRYRPQLPTLEEVVGGDAEFAGLLRQLLAWDPWHRLRADDMRRHLFAAGGGGADCPAPAPRPGAGRRFSNHSSSSGAAAPGAPRRLSASSSESAPPPPQRPPRAGSYDSSGTSGSFSSSDGNHTWGSASPASPPPAATGPRRPPPERLSACRQLAQRFPRADPGVVRSVAEHVDAGLISFGAASARLHDICRDTITCRVVDRAERGITARAVYPAPAAP